MFCVLVMLKFILVLDFGVLECSLELISNIRKVIPNNVLAEAWILFTLINIDLIVLAKACASLPTMLKLSSVVGWPIVAW